MIISIKPDSPPTASRFRKTGSGQGFLPQAKSIRETNKKAGELNPLDRGIWLHIDHRAFVADGSVAHPALSFRRTVRAGLATCDVAHRRIAGDLGVGSFSDAAAAQTIASS